MRYARLKHSEMPRSVIKKRSPGQPRGSFGIAPNRDSLRYRAKSSRAFARDDADGSRRPELAAQKRCRREVFQSRSENNPGCVGCQTATPARPRQRLGYRPQQSAQISQVAGSLQTLFRVTDFIPYDQPDRCGGRPYSTVTDLARLRGWSTSVPRSTAT